MGKIIALSGEMLTGKDTFAEVFVERGYIKASFAENLKNMCQHVFNLSPYHTDTQEGKATVFNPPIPFTKSHLSAIAQWIAKTHDLTSIGGKLKEIDEHLITEYQQKNGGPFYFHTPRSILQFVGTEICRYVSTDYHVDVLFQRLSNNPEANWIITDARFENERLRLKNDFDAVLVRIKRPSISTTAGHASENSMGIDEDYDYVIINNSTIEKLQAEALNLV